MNPSLKSQLLKVIRNIILESNLPIFDLWISDDGELISTTQYEMSGYGAQHNVTAIYLAFGQLKLDPDFLDDLSSFNTAKDFVREYTQGNVDFQLWADVTEEAVNILYRNGWIRVQSIHAVSFAEPFALGKKSIDSFIDIIRDKITKPDESSLTIDLLDTKLRNKSIVMTFGDFVQKFGSKSKQEEFFSSY